MITSNSIAPVLRPRGLLATPAYLRLWFAGGVGNDALGGITVDAGEGGEDGHGDGAVGGFEDGAGIAVHRPARAGGPVEVAGGIQCDAGRVAGAASERA